MKLHPHALYVLIVSKKYVKLNESIDNFGILLVLNPCLKNNVCGKYGKCINLHRDVYCECTTIFMEGKYCDKGNFLVEYKCSESRKKKTPFLLFF